MSNRTDGERRRRVEAEHEDSSCWVVLVTEGLSVAFPPDVYTDELAAERAAEHRARMLADAGRSTIERPFPGRWQVGEVWVRLVPARTPTAGPEIWVGTHWTPDGYPDPEAVLFASRAEAREWATSPLAGTVAIRIRQTRRSIAAEFVVRGGEAQSEVHLGRVVS